MFHAIILLLNSIKSRSIILTLVANLVPIIGVLEFGWNISNIILLYYFESIVIIIFSYKKILSNENYELPKVFYNGRLLTSHEEMKRLLASLSIQFFGLAFAIYSVFVFVMFAPDLIQGDNIAQIIINLWKYALLLILNIIFMIVGYYYEYKVNYIRNGDNKIESLGTLFHFPMKRMIIMHLTVVLGGVTLDLVGQSYRTLFVFIGVKTIIDLYSLIHKAKQSTKTMNISKSRGRTSISYE